MSPKGSDSTSSGSKTSPSRSGSAKKSRPSGERSSGGRSSGGRSSGERPAGKRSGGGESSAHRGTRASSEERAAGRSPHSTAQGASQAAGRAAPPQTPVWKHESRPLRFVTAHGAVSSAGTPLFGPLSAEIRTFLDALPQLLDTLMPLSSAHRQALPDAVSELSALLTSERGGLALPYWSAPRLTSAYMRYFLPWNLLRMGRFLPRLALPVPPAGAQILDLGSGPLTVPLALWLALPQWRDIPLELVAVDSSSQALELGRKLFQLMAPQSPWRIRTVRAPLHKALREVRTRPFLLTAGNVLNELADRKERRGDTTQTERMADIAGRFATLVAHEGAVLCIEPGTRLGGTVLEQVRAGAIEAGLIPVSPCPHVAECPLLERRGPGSGWCHASMDTDDAPAWLRLLAKEARLGKASLSLSHLVLRPEAALKGEKTASPHRSGVPEFEKARVLSDAFAVPELGLARYACTKKGLALIAAAGGIAQGALVSVRESQPPRKDPKSGARVLVAIKE